MSEGKVLAKDQVLIDEVRESPVDQYLFRFRRIVLLVLLAIVALIVIWLAVRFLTDRPVSYTSAEDHFKYGSIGSEVGGSLARLGQRLDSGGPG